MIHITFHRPGRPHLPLSVHQIDAHKAIFRVAGAGHLFYYGTVCIETLATHALYGYSAGAMFVLTCIGLFLHEEV